MIKLPDSLPFVCLIFSLCFLNCSNNYQANQSPGKSAVQEGEKTFQWPDGARAAVCLTYDDGIDGHLDIAAPDLEEVNLRGSFYAQGSSHSLAERMEDWRALVGRGHELGNHSLFHPCIRTMPDGEVREWLPPEYAFENYTVQQIAAELKIANTLLQAVDGKPERTYAYTCSDHLAGGESFVDEIRPLFTAARTGGDNIVADMRTLDIHLVPSWGVVDVSGEAMIDFVKKAEGAGTMAVFMFHGVGGGHNLNVSRESHRKLIAYLNAHRDRLWTGTFAQVMDHVRSERHRLGF